MESLAVRGQRLLSLMRVVARSPAGLGEKTKGWAAQPARLVRLCLDGAHSPGLRRTVLDASPLSGGHPTRSGARWTQICGCEEARKRFRDGLAGPASKHHRYFKEVLERTSVSPGSEANVLP